MMVLFLFMYSMAKQKISAQFVTHVAENGEELKLTNFQLYSLTIKQIDKSQVQSYHLPQWRLSFPR